MIRKWAALVLALALLVSAACAEGGLRGYSGGDGYVYVTFGRYFQSIDGGVPDDGQQTWKWHQQSDKEQKEAKRTKTPFDPGELEADPILWRVLSADGDRVLLMSEFVLFADEIHPDLKEYREIGSDFGKTQLCAKLNGEFAEEAFTAEELEAVIPYETMGKIRLPDSDMLKNREYGFGTNKSRKAWATEYAIRMTGAYTYQTHNGNHNPYWTCVQSTTNPQNARSIKADGSIGNLYVYQKDMGIRPVVTLDMGKVEVAGGSGTREDPYRLEAAAGPEEE